MSRQDWDGTPAASPCVVRRLGDGEVVRIEAAQVEGVRGPAGAVIPSRTDRQKAQRRRSKAGTT